MIDLLVGPVSALLSRVIPDKSERDKLAHEIATMAEKQAHEQIMAQVEVNKQEAAHKSLFVAGGRPFIVWVCGVSMAFNYVGIPLIDLVVLLGGREVTIEPLDLELMLPVLFGLLGLGGMRTYEKRHGVAREK